MRRALLALALLLAGCVAPAQPPSPLQAPAPWGASPLAVRPALRYRVALPIVEGQGWTLHGYAVDGFSGDKWRDAESAAISVEAPLWHIWWWGPGVRGLPACRGLAECERLTPATVARYSAHRYVLIGNEFNNTDRATGGWPEKPADVAAYLADNAPAWRGRGFKIVCCNLYVGPGNYTAESWWTAFKRTGSLQYVDVCGMHIFGMTTADAISAKRRIDAMCGSKPKAITEAGWGPDVGNFVQRINEPGYLFALSLWSAR